MQVILIDDSDIDNKVNTKLLKLARLTSDIVAFTDPLQAFAYVETTGHLDGATLDSVGHPNAWNGWLQMAGAFSAAAWSGSVHVPHLHVERQHRSRRAQKG